MALYPRASLPVISLRVQYVCAHVSLFFVLFCVLGGWATGVVHASMRGSVLPLRHLLSARCLLHFLSLSFRLVPAKLILLRLRACVEPLVLELQRPGFVCQPAKSVAITLFPLD